MKTVLIVEDDENKRKQLTRFMSDRFPDVAIREAQSYRSGLRALMEGNVNVVLLDMTMPSFDVTVEDDGGHPQRFAGREILRQMHRRGILTPVVVVTQFDQFGTPDDIVTLAELDRQLTESHAPIYLGTVFYSAGSDTWKAELAGYLTRLVGE